ncbi:MAG: hypothetical protein ACR2IY_09765, partial [Rubrivivax sp.]
MSRSPAAADPVDEAAILAGVDEAAILAAVAAQRDEAVALLQELVAAPSLLGDEAGAQVLMKREFERNGLDIHEFEVDED